MYFFNIFGKPESQAHHGNEALFEPKVVDLTEALDRYSPSHRSDVQTTAKPVSPIETSQNTGMTDAIRITHVEAHTNGVKESHDKEIGLRLYTSLLEPLSNLRDRLNTDASDILYYLSMFLKGDQDRTPMPA